MQSLTLFVDVKVRKGAMCVVMGAVRGAFDVGKVWEETKETLQNVGRRV